VSSLLEQTVEAFHQDMGITSTFLPVDNLNPFAPGPNPDHASDPEVGDGQVQAVVDYLRMLAPPAPGPWTASRQRGQVLFASVGCVGCHVPTMRTGASAIQALSAHDVTLYSDLLLHDMGPGLADNRPDGSADGSEWRTAPLWGMRIAREFLNGELFLLHDGRAHSVADAITLHGGEATAARDAFQALPAADRAALLDFVESR
jgi:CxxC motif-containing protein (DUF1111 family)